LAHPSEKNACRTLARKLGVGNAVRSIVSRQYRAERDHARRIISDIDAVRFGEICDRFGESDAGEKPSKYLRLEEYVQTAVGRAIALGLHESSGLRVLDIGCGNGYFLAAARYFGHDPIGIDVFDEPLYAELIGLLGLTRLEFRIEAATRLPEFDRPLDLITAYMVCFNRLGDPQPWTADEWMFFIDDCRSRLSPNGRIYLELNPDKRTDYIYLSDATADALRRNPGVDVAKSKAVITVST
jgi:cyclopropane fatty-acyl-phospholipid synthase-like methyltransferase